MVTSPNGDDTVHSFTHWLDYGQVSLNRTLPPSYETRTDYYSGAKSGNVVLKSVQTVYQDKSVGPHLPISVKTTWPQQGNLVSRVETDWDTFTDPVSQTSTGPWLPNLSWGNPTEKREFAFYTSGSGTQARKTDYQYAHIPGNTGYNVNYRNLNIANRVTEKTVYGTSKVADAKTVYDGSTPTPTNGVSNHDGSIGTYRGNPTTLSVWRNLPDKWLDTINTYNDAGDLLTSKDPNLNPTTYHYTDAWADTSCTLGSKTLAFPTLTTDALGHRIKHKYYRCTGQKQSTQDENDILANRTGTTYSYDLMLRPSTVNSPDGGQTSYSYTDTSGSVSITGTQTIKSGTNRVTVSSRDGLGREYKSQLTSDPDGTDTVDTTFDLLGRKSTVSNPHRTGSTSTDGTTTYQYDALNRITKEIPPDGTSSANNVTTAYGAQTTGTLCLTTTVTDQAGKSRKSCSDALGHLVAVFEDPGSKNYETDYSYDVLDNLLSVTQNGSDSAKARTRAFLYDSLSRLTSDTNPESGNILYSYTNSGGTLCAGDISAVCVKTAPAPNQSSGTVTTTYTYDVLNRLTWRSYSDGVTPSDQWGYDISNITMGTHQFTVNNPIGRLSESTGGVTPPYNDDAMVAYSYDTMGRVVSFWNGVNNLALRFDYTYNLDGSPATLTYPSGRILSYTVKGAGRVTDIKDVANGVNYVTSATYAPPGELAGMINGSATGFAGITTTDSYNKRLQPSVLSASTASQTVFSRSYDFEVGTADNGTVSQIVNGLDGNRTQNFTYDSLNRITQANTTGPNWGETFTVDAWGNLTNRGSVSGKTNYEPLNAAPASTKNQLPGFGYDAAGNMTSNGSATYTYDADNRLSSTGGWTYVYDADGHRVRKSNGSTGTVYTLGAGSDPLLETDLAGNVLEEYIYFNGQRVARRDASGAVHYYFADHLGSASVVTDASGNVQKEADYYPYGGEIAISGSDANHYKFTGKERDETGLDEFGARYYSSAMGRFMTPDWSEAPVAVPYAVLGNPQTLNLYSYVENNPATGTDPDGHAGGNDINPYIGDASGFYDCKIQGGACDGKDQTEKAQPVPQPAPPQQETTVVAAVASAPTTPTTPLQSEIDAVVEQTLQLTEAGAGKAGNFLLDAAGNVAGAALFVVTAGVGQTANNGKDTIQTSVGPPTPMNAADHTKGARPSTKEKHEEGGARKRKDRGGEKGDKRPPRKRPPNWSGKWPPDPGTPWW